MTPVEVAESPGRLRKLRKLRKLRDKQRKRHTKRYDPEGLELAIEKLRDQQRKRLAKFDQQMGEAMRAINTATYLSYLDRRGGFRPVKRPRDTSEFASPKPKQRIHLPVRITIDRSQFRVGRQRARGSVPRRVRRPTVVAASRDGPARPERPDRLGKAAACGLLLSDGLLELASDVGRLRSRVEAEHVYIVDRLAQRIVSLWLMVTPPAAVVAAETAPGDDEVVLEAIRLVDDRMQVLLRRLGGKQ
jgi:hypothetical protein